VTPVARAVHDLLRAGDRPGAAALLPDERPYPLTPDLVAAVAASKGP
jgi:hypothetical protein